MANQIDAFGTLQFQPGSTFRARLIEVSKTELAFFPETGSGAEAGVLYLNSPYTIKGRVLTASISDDTTIRFARASCGCQTPHDLRGPRSRFLQTLKEYAT